MDRDLLLSPDKDPMGTAMSEYLKDGKAAKLRVLSPQFDEDEIPVAQLFRTEGAAACLGAHGIASGPRGTYWM